MHRPLAEESPPSTTPPRAPRLAGLPLIGSAWSMRRDPLGTMTGAMATHGDVVGLRLGPYWSTLIRNPDHIRHVFVDNADNYTKLTRGYDKAKLVLGQGLVTSEGELWQRQRRTANPAFGRQRVATFAPLMTGAANDMLRDWREVTARGESLDVFREMMRVTLRIAAEVFLGVKVGAETDELARTVSLVLERTNDIITNPLSLPIGVPTYKNVTFKRAIAHLDRFVYRVIAEHRARDEQDNAPTPERAAHFSGQLSERESLLPQAPDLLSVLMSARDEQTGQAMSDQQLRDEAVTLLIAGHETVANALSWAFHLLGQHPGAEARLREELARVLAGRLPTMDDLPNLPFTRAVFEETMRLYPPAWMIGRAAKNDDEVGGHFVPGGTFVLVSPYMTHRHPGLWDRPDAFDPDRFLDGRAEAQPKFAYLPFGGGPRFCIGAIFATVEATLLLATVYSQCTLRPASGPPVVPYAMITLRPRFGVRMMPNWM